MWALEIPKETPSSDPLGPTSQIGAPQSYDGSQYEPGSSSAPGLYGPALPPENVLKAPEDIFPGPYSNQPYEESVYNPSGVPIDYTHSGGDWCGNQLIDDGQQFTGWEITDGDLEYIEPWDPNQPFWQQ